MKKPIGKQRRKYLKRFLAGSRRGWDAGHVFWYGLLPDSPSHKQGRDYWRNKYYTIYYADSYSASTSKETQENRARRFGYVYSPLTDDDIKYIEALINIDPFLADEENKEYVTT